MTSFPRRVWCGAEGALKTLQSPLGGLVEVDQRLVRPNEVENLRADCRLARTELAWVPGLDFPGLVRMMVESDLASAGMLPLKSVSAD